MNLITRFRAFVRHEEGQDLLEYALLVALIALVAAVAISGTASAAVDLWTRRVPNRLTLGIAACGVALAAGHFSSLSVGHALAGLVVGLLLMLPGHLIGKTGAGDVKLFAALG